MKRTILSIFVFALILGLRFAHSQMIVPSPVTVSELRCEYRDSPLGIDVIRPRLSWKLSSSRRGEMQTAYQVLVASSAEKLAAYEGDLWDSGRVASDADCQVEYAGK